MKHLNLLLVLFSILLFSCKENKKDQIAQLVAEWQGKEILFPEKVVFTRFAIDTTDFEIPQSEYKILIYVDSIGCTSCKLQLQKWKELITYTDSVTDGKISFLFFFHPKDLKEVSYLLKRDRFDRPICIDMEDQLNKLNKFPADMTFQTFLLDKNNKVAVLGNPIHNLAVKDLYIKQITGKENPTAKMIKTTALAEQSEMDLGTFSQSETKKVTFTIKNTGDNPLVILDISTTCGCAVATFDKQPAKPGETLQVAVEMTPKDTGFFDETLSVKCNTSQPVKLKIKGQAN